MKKIRIPYIHKKADHKLQYPRLNGRAVLKTKYFPSVRLNNDVRDL